MSGGRSEYPHIIAFLGILSNFLYALAASIFITFFITKKIDEHEGKRIHEELSELRNNINEDVFGAVFKSVMLDEIYDAVKKGVIANPLVRRDAVWIHDYRKDSNGRMCRKLTLQSKILNTSGSAYKDLFKIRVDSHDEGGEIVASILCKNHEEIIAKYLVTNPSENHNVFQDPENENILNVEINVGARAQVDIVIVTDAIYSSDLVTDGYFTTHPVIDTMIIANFPKEYSFEIFETSSSPFEKTVDEPDRVIYESKGAMLPHQGIMYYLNRRDASGGIS